MNPNNTKSVTVTALWTTKKYLFKDGDEYTQITGGYSGLYETIGGWSVGSQLVNDGSYLHLFGNGTRFNLFASQSSFIISGKTSLHIIGKYTCDRNCGTIGSDTGFYGTLRISRGINAASITDSCKIITSSFEECVVTIGTSETAYFYGYSSSWKDYPTSGGGNSDTYIKEIWLE